MKFLAIIPARFASTRLPGKPLSFIHGKPMIQHVYERVIESNTVDKVIVATDDDQIVDVVSKFGGECTLTSPLHNSGTERCAEVASLFIKEYDVVINVQGDEPFISFEHFSILKKIFLTENDVQIASLIKRITTNEELNNPNVVKALKSEKGNALYFSRSAIPFIRNSERQNWLHGNTFYKHIGLYGYRIETLLDLIKLNPTPLEQAESLEQLRWLENGYTIKLAETSSESLSVDTPEDLERANKFSI